MLRIRHEDKTATFDAGFKIGAPLAITGFGAAVYWGGVVQYWESSTARVAYTVVAAAVVLILLFIYVRTAVSHWANPARQNLRARARSYRELAHLARKGGGGHSLPLSALWAVSVRGHLPPRSRRSGNGKR